MARSATTRAFAYIAVTPDVMCIPCCPGLIVMAKDAKTQWHLSDQFKAHTVSCIFRLHCSCSLHMTLCCTAMAMPCCREA